MKTTVKPTFNLTPEQSKQLSNSGECIILEPMEEQPPKNTTRIRFYMSKGNARLQLYDNPSPAWENEHGFANWPSKYEVGQQVSLRQCHKWNCKYCGGGGSVAYYEICEECGGQGVFEKIESLSATIQSIDCKRVQELGISDYWYKMLENQMFKDFFNKHFSTPRPVECKDACENGIKYGYHKDEMAYCSSCGGDGIESWIAYLYDEDSKIGLMKRPGYKEKPEGNNSWKYKPLSIIVNPYLLLPRVKV